MRGEDSANAVRCRHHGLINPRHRPDYRPAGQCAARHRRHIPPAVQTGCGEKAGDAPETPAAASVARSSPADANELAGVSASPGLAVGRIAQYRQQLIDVAETGDSPERERARFDAAVHDSRSAIEELKETLSDPAKAQILDAHIELLGDPDLLDLVIEGISDGKSAGFAWRAAFTRYAEQLERLDNAPLRERANDIRDVGRRVLALLAGVNKQKSTYPRAPSSLLRNSRHPIPHNLIAARCLVSVPPPAAQPAMSPFLPAHSAFRQSAASMRPLWR